MCQHDFPFPVDHCMKITESEKRDNYKDVARELRKLRNIRMPVILIFNWLACNAPLKG